MYYLLLLPLFLISIKIYLFFRNYENTLYYHEYYIKKYTEDDNLILIKLFKIYYYYYYPWIKHFNFILIDIFMYLGYEPFQLKNKKITVELLDNMYYFYNLVPFIINKAEKQLSQDELNNILKYIIYKYSYCLYKIKNKYLTKELCLLTLKNASSGGIDNTLLYIPLKYHDEDMYKLSIQNHPHSKRFIY